MIKVFGHKAPDTDATGSPIIWAWYLSELRDMPAEAKLLGTPNTEAQFVLERWGFDQPEIIDGVYQFRCVSVPSTSAARIACSKRSAQVSALPSATA